jgi:hypothetical protein
MFGWTPIAGVVRNRILALATAGARSRHAVQLIASDVVEVTGI